MEKHKAYDVKFKLKVVDVAKKKSIAAAARKFSMDWKQSQEWLKQEGELLLFRKKGKVKSKCLKGRGRKAFDEDMGEVCLTGLLIYGDIHVTFMYDER